MKLLYIQASPRQMRSHSKAVADAFVEAWMRFNSGSRVEVHDIWHMDLPEFDGLAVEARYLIGAGKDYTPEHKAAWDKVSKFSKHFITFDRFVIASPMWNYHVPYKLKQYLDVVIQPKITFLRSDEPYKQEAARKKTALFLARNGIYPEGHPLDFQKPYLDTALKMMGLANNSFILLEGTGGTPANVKRMHTEKINEALALAQNF